MTNTGQDTLVLNFFRRTTTPESKPGVDSVQVYSEFLVDSLNPAKPDSTFRFELKEIILPEQAADSTISKVLFNQPSIFVIPKKHSHNIEPVTRQNPGSDWLTMLFMVCLVVLAWIRYYNFRRIKQLFKAVWGRHHVNQLVRDGNLFEERITPGLAVIYITCLAVIIFQFGYGTLGDWLGITRPWLVFIVVIAGISLLWLIKLVIIKFNGLIFRIKAETSELMLTNMIFNGATGIVIFPFIIAGFYSGNELFLKIAAIFLLTGMTLRFFRSLVIGLAAQTISVIYLFLYLCTLEILPLLFLYRLASGTE